MIMGELKSVGTVIARCSTNPLVWRYSTMNTVLLLTGLLALTLALVLYWNTPGNYFSVAQE